MNRFHLLALAAAAAMAALGSSADAEPAFKSRSSVTRSSDGQGNVSASGSGGFATSSGVMGRRGGSFARNADGSVSAERNTTATNANTGVGFDGSTTYTKGSGVSRSASCTDAAGNSVTCGPR